MHYVLRFSTVHPFDYMKGKEADLFRVKYVFDKWVRDESGGPGVWGYTHPRDGGIVRLASVGNGLEPRMGKVHISYSVEKIEEPEEAAPIIAGLLESGKTTDKEE